MAYVCSSSWQLLHKLFLQPSQPPHQLQTEWVLFNETTAAVPLQRARRV
jgi:hypothetical protein